MPQRKGQKGSPVRAVLICCIGCVLGCSREEVTFAGFPPLRTSTPVVMSHTVVTEVLEDLSHKLDTHALRLLRSTFVDCAQYQSELGWLAPTSPYARRLLVNILHEREISTARFTQYVREEPKSLAEGAALLAAVVEKYRGRLLRRAPDGCDVDPHWISGSVLTRTDTGNGEAVPAARP